MEFGISSGNQALARCAFIETNPEALLTGGTNADPNALYFTAGYNNQMDGLFGEIQATPEPGTIALLLSGLSLLGATRLVRRKTLQAS